MTETFSYGRYEKVRELKNGGFGKAILVIDKHENDKKKLLKKISIRDIDNNDLEIEEILDKVVNIAREALVLAKFSHPNIISFYESFSEANSFYIVTEYCQGGDLAKRLKLDKQRKITPRESQVVKWALNLTSALNYMHNIKIVLHRNIYPVNIFITEDEEAKFSDYGINKNLASNDALIQEEDDYSLYRAPEIHNGEDYKKASDVWSLGVVFCEMCTHELPFRTQKEILKKELTPIDLISSELNNIFKKMLAKDSPKRLSTSHLFKDLQLYQIKTNMRQTMASGSHDNTIKIWHIHQRQCLQTLAGHTNFVLCLLLLHDCMLASGSHDKTIKIWDLTKRVCQFTLSGHSNSIWCLKSIKRGVLASGSDDTSIKVWDLNKQNCLYTLNGHTDCVRCLELFPNGQLLSGSFQTLKIWDLSLKLCVFTLNGHSNYISCVLLLPQETFASCSWDRKIKLWNLFKRSCVATLSGHSNYVQCLKLLSNDTMASGSDDATIRIWDLNQHTCIYTITGHANYITCLLVLPDGSLASASCDKTIKIWDTSKRSFFQKESHKSLLATLKGHKAEVMCLELLP